MYAVKRQFHIWKHELQSAWDRVPFIGRIMLGAMIALGLSLLCVKKVLRPLNEEIAGLRKDLLVPENLDPEKDEEIIMNNDKAAKLKVSLQQWKERLAQFQSHAEYLQPDVHLEVISDVQDIVDRCGLTLISEYLVDPNAEQKAVRGRGSRRAAAKKVEKVVDTGPIGSYTHRYEITGGFRQIQAFLLLLEPLDWRISVHDLEVRPLDANYSVLSLRFVMDIHYLKEKS